MNSNITIVTGLWDLGRDQLSESFKRDFKQYKDRFFELLESDAQMCIWIPKELESEVLEIRKGKPTRIFYKELSDFETWNPFFDRIQEIRTNKDWYSQAGWLQDSPQAKLKYYNPMMFTKMFMVNDSAIINPFGSEYFFWIDGGLTNTVHKGYFQKDQVLDTLDTFVAVNNDKFIHISYPYEGGGEIHGFQREAIARYCDVEHVKYVCRGGFFGGHKKKVHDINSMYYAIMQTTLNDGYMGADECLFTILAHRHPDLIHRYEIEGNGLVWPFFEHLKNYIDYSEKNKKLKQSVKASLYVLTFNFPEQFKMLCESFEKVDPDFLNKPRKILINNSTDRTTDAIYDELCSKYGFEEIHKDNIGICGGRQFVAEHFDSTDSDYYIFFEDDMFLYQKEQLNFCKNGFRTYTDDLYRKTLGIIHENEFDYLKLSFSEFFGDSIDQWAWYNIPAAVREKYFPNKTTLPVMGLDPDAPKTLFKEMGKFEDCRYITGDIHYCNWPIWFGKSGNKKVFLDTKWARPYEQTWMSHVFQMQKEDKIKAAVMLLSPINHTRINFYKAEERREN